MQSVPSEYTRLQQADVRPIAVSLLISFPKDLIPTIDFFTIETSLIGGSDFIAGPGAVVQEWDKYIYTDYTDRIINIEWSRQVQEYSSVTLAMASFTLDNHDDLFTPGGGSIIENYILSGRPVRISAGFSLNTVPQFIGLTQGMPVIDERAKTATFNCIDFLSFLTRKSLDESVIYQNQRTDEILESLFTDQGLLSSQLDLSVGFNTIPVAYFEKGQVLLDAVKELMEAEGGRLYMSESGVITFRNRQEYSTDWVTHFSDSQSITSARISKEDDVINSVTINGGIRTVQPKQPYGQLSQITMVPPSGTVDVWIDFSDPVTSADDPVYITSAVTSSYSVNTAYDGSGSASSNVTLQSSDLFASSMKLTFANATTEPLYLTDVTIYATPAPVTQTVYVKEQDATSIGKHEEHELEITNDFFQSDTEAQSKAKIILHSYATLASVYNLEVKGDFALQIDDPVHVTIKDRVGDYRITKITNKVSLDGGYNQMMELRRQFEANNYFTIEQSLIGGIDQIAP